MNLSNFDYLIIACESFLNIDNNEEKMYYVSKSK